MANGGFIDITIEFEGTQGPEVVQRKLATWGQRIQTLAPAWQVIGEALLGDFAVNMVAEGGMFADGRKWAPLALSTAAERERLGYGGEHPIEYRTGLLAESLATQGALGNVFEVAPDSLVVGSDLEYAGWQQDGTSRMPARRLVGLSRRRVAAITRELGDFVREQARQAGLNVTGSSGGL